MYFFINNALSKQNSGIEHAQLQRAKVFQQYHLPYKLLYMSFNAQFEQWLPRFGLTRRDVLTLFDYYQDTNEMPKKDVLPEDIFLSNDKVDFQNDPQNKNCYLVSSNGNIMGRIHWFDLQTDNVKRVSMVERFDLYGNLYRVDEYDIRGFISRSQFYTPNNKVYMFVWFDKDGKPVITQNFSIGSDKKTIAGTWEVIDRSGYHTYHRSFSDVVVKFLNDLNNQYFEVTRPNYFVGDRMEGYEDALMRLDKPAIKIAHLHNSHGGDVHDELHSILNNYYEFDLYNNDRYDFYIAATNKQTNDVRERFGLGDKVVTIPVGLTIPLTRIPQAKRKRHSVLVTARRAEEKRIEKMIEAVAIAHEKIPDISIDVYGYRDGRNNDAAKKKIDNMIKKYNASDYVSINEYNPNLDEQRDLHQVYMVFSTMEGFNIALMEAQNHGEIGIVNDVNYGPNELVQNGKNGYVVGYNDVNAAAEKLVEVFSNDQLLQQLSDGAYDLSKRYDASEIYKAWMDISNRSEEYWQKLNLQPIPKMGLEEIDDIEAQIKQQETDKHNREVEWSKQQNQGVLDEIAKYDPSNPVTNQGSNQIDISNNKEGD